MPYDYSNYGEDPKNIAALSMRKKPVAAPTSGSVVNPANITDLLIPALSIVETIVSKGKSPGTNTWGIYNAQKQNEMLAKQGTLDEALKTGQLSKQNREEDDYKEDQAAARRYSELKILHPDWDEDKLMTESYSPMQRNFKSFSQKQAALREDPDAMLKTEKLKLDIDKSKREAANPLTTQQQTAAGQLRGEFISQSADFIKVRDSYYNVKTLEKGPVGDIGLVFSYMKTIDPGSTVREGEQASVRNARNVPDQVTGLYNRVLSGLSLTDSQRDEIKRQVKNLYSAQLNTHKQREKTFREYAKSYEIPEKYIVAPLYEIEQELKPNPSDFEE